MPIMSSLICTDIMFIVPPTQQRAESQGRTAHVAQTQHRSTDHHRVHVLLLHRFVHAHRHAFLRDRMQHYDVGVRVASSDHVPEESPGRVEPVPPGILSKRLQIRVLRSDAKLGADIPEQRVGVGCIHRSSDQT